jgi:hypothetical protein
MYRYSILYSLVLLAFSLTAQVTLERQVIGSLGQQASTAEIQVSSTVGEASVTTLRSGNVLLTQGFQQAEPEDLTGVHFVPELLDELSAYPNPANGAFRIRLTSLTTRDITAEVVDVNGRTLAIKSMNVRATETMEIPFLTHTWPGGIYFVHLTTGEGRLMGSLRVLVQ